MVWLHGLVQGLVDHGLLHASLSPEAADYFVIAVPTHIREDHQPETSHVVSATRTIAPVLKADDLVMLELTSPVGTTEQVLEMIAEARPDLKVTGHCTGTFDLFIAYCSKRVLPGRILIELINNDRVIGGITLRYAHKAMRFCRQFVRGACLTTSARAAEMVQFVENSYPNVNIAFANELSMITDGMGIDVWEVIALANRHSRVNILQPGPGVGCAIRKIKEHPDARVTCLGLACEPNIDDFRESPAATVAAGLALALVSGSHWSIMTCSARSRSTNSPTRWS